MAAINYTDILHARALEVDGRDLSALLARQFLSELGAKLKSPACAVSVEQEIEAWRDSGLASVSPVHPHVPLASAADALLFALNSLLNEPRVNLCGRRLLGMRALSHKLQLAAQSSANGSCRLLACRHGILAVNLARSEDWELLPAWLEDEAVQDWKSLASAMAQRSAVELLDRARLLGLPVAHSEQAQDRAWYQARRVGQQRALTDPQKALRVLDLSALWAGPLCSAVLQFAGVDVLRIENPQRPDGARMGPPAFYAALNASKQSIALDLSAADGQLQFHRLLGDADLVIESSRPRALQQLGLDAEALLQQYPGLNWLSITGYGRDEPEAQWVAFGDDAAVAGGLAEEMARYSGQPQFFGDAIADPITGLHAALLAIATMQSGGGYLLSVPMRDVMSNLIVRGHRLFAD
ncbi:MAG: CoA transferase [Oceanococcus sp.]